jgi:hypothetical protein
MSATSATSEADRAISSDITNDVPPILRLPVELRNIIYNYATIREEWPTHRHGEWVSRGSLATLAPRQRAFLTNKSSDPEATQLINSHALSQVNKQVRADSSEFVRTFSSIPVVTKVQNLDFSHVMHFLSGLEDSSQDAFKVGHDGNSKRKLTIELQGPYSLYPIQGLWTWGAQVQSFLGQGEKAELAALYKTVPEPLEEDEHYIFREHRMLVVYVHGCHEHCAPGGGRFEVGKVVQTLLCRYQTECRWRGQSCDWD